MSLTNAFILLLWAADKHLLSKIWNMMWTAGKRAAWSGLTLYSNWRYSYTNEMSKDGYHVDFVYLYDPIDEQNNRSNEIDLLAHFRYHINQKTFTNNKPINLGQFIELCLSPDSNFNEYEASKKYELVVRYTFDHKQYIIVFDTTTDMRFPVYTETEIRERSMKNSDSIGSGYLTASEEDEDGINIYEHLKRLAGPMENFYAGTEYKVLRHHLNYAGLKMDVDNGGYIKMTDFWGSEFCVKPDQSVIKLEK